MEIETPGGAWRCPRGALEVPGESPVEVPGNASEVEYCCRMLNCPSCTFKLPKRCLVQVLVVVLVAMSALLPKPSLETLYARQACDYMPDKLLSDCFLHLALIKLKGHFRQLSMVYS